MPDAKKPEMPDADASAKVCSTSSFSNAISPGPEEAYVLASHQLCECNWTNEEGTNTAGSSVGKDGVV